VRGEEGGDPSTATRIPQLASVRARGPEQVHDPGAVSPIRWPVDRSMGVWVENRTWRRASLGQRRVGTRRKTRPACRRPASGVFRDGFPSRGPRGWESITGVHTHERQTARCLRQHPDPGATAGRTAPIPTDRAPFPTGRNSRPDGRPRPSGHRVSGNKMAEFIRALESVAAGERAVAAAQVRS